VLLISALFTARRAQRCQRRVRAPRGASGVEIINSEVPLAYALPGSPGQIVVSSAMLDFLDADEQRVLMAHEQAHLDHHHHRYVRIGEIAAAAFPVLLPLAKRIRLATERWADEIAAGAVGDRVLVAHAVANAALAQPEARPGILGMSDSGVVERVAALLIDPPARRRLAEALATAVIAVSLVVLVGSFIQAHHWIVRVLSLCVPGT
jgi:beta-lactamase regulating signal transducer with metallopeptidase domain